MAESSTESTLLSLMAWLSPAFPVGSYSYSHGLERAAHDGAIADAGELEAWIADLLAQGSGWNDAVLFAEAWRRADAGEPLAEISELGIALAGSAERLHESASQGSAFATAMSNWGGDAALPPDCPYCVAIGAHAAAAGIPLETALLAYLQAFSSNLIQAGIRLSLLGQSGAVQVLSRLGGPIMQCAARAARSTLDDLGSCTLASEIAAMNHETQYSRLFRT